MDLDNSKQELKPVVDITDQNWSFIKHLQNGKKPQEAYVLAGYKGNPEREAYSLSWKLKKRLEQAIESDGFNKARLMLEVGKLLDMPLDPKKEVLTYSEKLRSLKLFASILPEAKQESRVTITNFTINRFTKPSEEAKGIYQEVDKGTNGPEKQYHPSSNPNPKDVIDIDEIS